MICHVVMSASHDRPLESEVRKANTATAPRDRRCNTVQRSDSCVRTRQAASQISYSDGSRLWAEAAGRGSMKVQASPVHLRGGERRIGSPNEFRTYDPSYSCCNRQVAGIQISTVVAPRRCGIHHLFAQTWRVRVNKCRRFATTNTTLRRPDVF